MSYINISGRVVALRTPKITRFINRLMQSIITKKSVVTLGSALSVAHIRADGSVTDYGVVSRRVVTDAGVAYLVDDWIGGTSDISLFNFHACGTGTNPESAGDTALQSESTVITSRVAGTISAPAVNVVRSVGVMVFSGGGIISEHGIFNTITASSGVLWDRSLVGPYTVVAGDGLIFTYDLTVNSGG
jgi:hypothetical protein